MSKLCPTLIWLDKSQSKHYIKTFLELTPIKHFYVLRYICYSVFFLLLDLPCHPKEDLLFAAYAVFLTVTQCVPIHSFYFHFTPTYTMVFSFLNSYKVCYNSLFFCFTLIYPVVFNSFASLVSQKVTQALQFTLSTFTLLWPTPWSFICCPSFSNSSLILFSSSFHMSVRTVTSAITMATNNNSEMSY